MTESFRNDPELNEVDVYPRGIHCASFPAGVYYYLSPTPDFSHKHLVHVFWFRFRALKPTATYYWSLGMHTSALRT